jgi:hypothetical protein
MNHHAETAQGSNPEVIPEPQGSGYQLAVKTANGITVSTVNRLQFNLVKLVDCSPFRSYAAVGRRSSVTLLSQDKAGNLAVKGASVRRKWLLFDQVRQVDFSSGNSSLPWVVRSVCEAALSCRPCNVNVGV